MITLKNVSKTFNHNGKALEILKDINLKVVDGEFLCVLGPSGCGKTTLLRMMAGLDFPTSGEIREGDKIVSAPTRGRGFVFQQYSLFPWMNVLDNVSFGLELRGIAKKERYIQSRKYLKMVGLLPFQDSYPHELSGGMKQRVAIARCLVNKTRILLMDEPFSALDVQTREKLQGELVKIWENEKKTVVFVTHSVDEAVFLADRIVVLSSGPGCVLQNIPIKMKRIRDRTSYEFLDIKKYIINLLND
ncbi:MAG: ABC transporter ATP-binding protein [Methanobacteriaceae archaeon]|jgi:NitT/TauT family transport system ATP-binding protein|nr:MAG: nitrate ABC transporter ATP-binding protein [Methanobacterium sp. BRmetb2]MCC7558299.1 ABC transporter ATP-binding protein [Methanobacteriaceae archaeon]